ncbi:hypothetical protein [Aliikangiella sp. G2MR2-5]|uniref:PKD domain-containing protein n=1 Tax=Aliikangiella sp. G2MR2-5 TaxID=2788943 RepID=UPI0018AB70E7|nr:hypothetical protein [Aliikangiella sp. G2MR2-5]
MNIRSKITNTSTLSLALLAIVACGGGGGGDPTPPENNKPSVSAGTDQTVDEMVAVILEGSGTDSDGSIASYAWTQTSGTSVTLTNSNSASAAFTAPSVDADEVLVFELTVTDNDGASSTDSVSVTVINNLLPAVNAGEDQTVDENVQVTLEGMATDSDGTIATYSWVQTEGQIVSLSSSDSASINFKAPSVLADETLVFELTVTDNDGESATDSVSVTVRNIDDQMLTIHSNTKHCGDELAFDDGEILLHSSDGSIVRRVALHSSGTTLIAVDGESVNFTLITRETQYDASVKTVAKTFYSADANGEYFFANTDYANLPENCTCEDANVSLTTPFGEGGLDFSLTAADYRWTSTNFDTTEQTVKAFCSKDTDDIYAFKFKRESSELTWGVDSYQVNVDDTAFINPEENFANASISINSLPLDYRLTVYLESLSSNISHNFIPDDLNNVPVISNLTPLDGQVFHVSASLSYDAENTILSDISYYNFRGNSTEDFTVSVIENPGNASFALDLDQGAYTVTPNELGFSAPESYLYLSESDGYAMIYAPLTENALELSLPEYPSEYSLDFSDGPSTRVSRVRKYSDDRNYRDAIAKRYGNELDSVDQVVAVTELDY